MHRFRDGVLRVKDRFKINNVYDCAKPLLVLAGLFGIGGTRICYSEDVYTLRNSKFSLLVFTFASLVYSPYVLMSAVVNLFTVFDPPRPLIKSIAFIMLFITRFLTMSTIGIGCIMTHVYCKRLETMLQIINNIDSQLELANIRVNHWKITVKVMVLTLISVRLYDLLDVEVPEIVLRIAIHLLYMWAILFLLIIHERFVCLNKLLQENVTLTSIQIVGERNPRDNYMLRRITLGRHVFEQLTEVVQLFSDTGRYMLIGLTVVPIIATLLRLLALLSLLIRIQIDLTAAYIYSSFIQIIRILVIIIICQVNKAERRVLTARLRHLVAFETDREIIQQVQQYIMYNAYSTPGLIDFQFSDIDNTLLLTIIDVIVSNALIIVSYTRQ